jgi:hypothetical protein
MDIINQQINNGIEEFGDKVKRIVIPYHWFAHSFTRIPNIKFEGHDMERIEFYDENNECLQINVTVKLN